MGERPSDIPSSPPIIYKEKWVSWGEFLGTGRVYKKSFRSYEAAQALMEELGIRTQRQFREWSRSDLRPEDIPSNPDHIYRTEWTKWNDFLGTKNINSKKFRSYKEAQALMKELGIKTSVQFQERSRSGERPFDIPFNPRNIYKSEWKGFGEFLGVNGINWRSYKEAQALMKELGIRTQEQFHKWSRSGERPEDIPSNPSRVYKTKWVSWGEFLGTGRIYKKSFRSYESAQALMKKLDISTQEQFYGWIQSGKKPDDVPFHPNRVYKAKWKGWDEFLGPKWMSYRIGQQHVRQIGIKTVKELLEWLKSNNRPRKFPSNPHIVWEQSWNSAESFLQIQWMSFKEACAYVQQKGVASREEYSELVGSEKVLSS